MKQIDLRKTKLSADQQHYRAVGLVLFLVAVGTILARILVRFLPTTNEILADTVFSLVAQIGLFVAMPTAIFVMMLKKRQPRQLLEFANILPTKRANIWLSIPLALCLTLSSMGVSFVWQVVLAMFGYQHSAAVDYLPATFNPLVLVLMLFITAVLPGICEEYLMRGGFLTVMRRSWDDRRTVWICAIAFGLFHSWVPQFGYTAAFGAVMAYLVIITRSVIPAMIIHFFNNAFNTYLEFATKYGWWMGDFLDNITYLLLYDTSLLVLLFGLCVSCAIGLIYLLHNINKTDTLATKRDIIQRSGFDHTHQRVVIVGEFDEQVLRQAELTDEVFGTDWQPDRYRPTVRDHAFYVGAIVVTGLATLFSFVWGLF